MATDDNADDADIANLTFSARARRGMGLPLYGNQTTRHKSVNRDRDKAGQMRNFRGVAVYI